MSGWALAILIALEAAWIAPKCAREIRAWRHHFAEEQDRRHRFAAAVCQAKGATSHAERQAAIDDMTRIINEAGRREP